MRESLAHQLVFGTFISLTVATFVGFLGEFGWFFDLASHFRLQFSSLGLLLATLYIFRLKTKLAFYCLILMFINIFPLWSTTEKGNAGHLNPTASQSVIVSFNLDRQNINYDSVITYLSGSNADIVFLTEVTAAWRPQLRKLQEAFPYHFEVPEWVPSEEQDSKFWWRKGDPAMSVALFSKIPWTFVKDHSLGVTGRSLAIRSHFSTNGYALSLIAVQLLMPLPSYEAGLQETELKGLARLVKELNGPLLVIGDFNLTPYSARFRKLLNKAGLHRAPGGINPTYPAKLGLFALPLDHTLFKGGMNLNVIAGPNLGSDHRPIITTLTYLAPTSARDNRNLFGNQQNVALP